GGVRPGDYHAAAASEVVLPAMFLRDGLLETLRPFAPQFAGKLYLDITNPFNADYTDFILPWDTSAAEEVQRAFPRARVVGAFKNVWWEVFDAPRFGGLLSDVFVVGDDDPAKRRFLALAEGMPFRFLDAGRLQNARTVERMTLLSGELGQRQGLLPPHELPAPRRAVVGRAGRPFEGVDRLPVTFPGSKPRAGARANRLPGLSHFHAHSL